MEILYLPVQDNKVAPVVYILTDGFFSFSKKALRDGVTGAWSGYAVTVQ